MFGFTFITSLVVAMASVTAISAIVNKGINTHEKDD